MPSDLAIHSDLLVHWTGAKDIEEQYGTSDWHTGNSSRRDDEMLARAYIERLESILRFGLWMTDQAPPQIGSDAAGHKAPCTCFTELKLSQSRQHAVGYGRLGVAFKRPFLFSRGGRPVVYYGSTDNSWTRKDRFLHACATDLKDRRLMHFFKPMNSSTRLNYDLYSESEWRIVFHEDELREGRIVDPRDRTSSAHAYFTSLPPEGQRKLRYLIPVDGWLALIIYPTIKIKNIAQRPDSPIRELLREIKSRDDHPNRVEGGNLPVELDLDLCRHF